MSDYKRVIGLADTEVHGQFFNAGSHFVTFDRAALPQSQIVTWYKAPAKEDDEYVSGCDDSSFRLDDLKGMNVSAAIAERGHDYYMENKVSLSAFCSCPAPFKDKNGRPYLESHHIIWLAKGGADSIDNTIALCPNCHRKMHVINAAADVKILLEKAKRNL